MFVKEELIQDGSKLARDSVSQLSLVAGIFFRVALYVSKRIQSDPHLVLSPTNNRLIDAD